MRVEITRLVRFMDAGQERVLTPGELRELSPTIARALLAQGAAVAVPHETREAAVLVPAEAKRGRRRG